MSLTQEQEQGFEFEIYNFLADLNVHMLMATGRGIFRTVIIVPESGAAKFGLGEFTRLSGIFTTYRKFSAWDDWVKYTEIDFSGVLVQKKETPFVICTEYFPDTVPTELRKKLEEFCRRVFDANVNYEVGHE